MTGCDKNQKRAMQAADIQKPEFGSPSRGSTRCVTERSGEAWNARVIGPKTPADLETFQGYTPAFL